MVWSNLDRRLVGPNKTVQGFGCIGGVAPASPLFHLPLNDSGISNLDQSLTVNGSTVTPSFVYEGKNAANPTWTATTGGGDLTLSAAGNMAFNQPTPLLDSTDESVLFDGTNRYDAASADIGAITTGDFVVEAVVRMDEQSVDIIACHQDATNGWYLGQIGAGNQLGVFVDDGTTTKAVTGAIVSNHTWHHVIVFVDRNGGANGATAYVNTDPGTTINFDTVSATLKSTNPLRIGNWYTGGNDFKGNLAYLAVWENTAWFSGGATNQTQWQAIASERFAKLTGIYPTTAAGTALPSISARATTAHLDKYNETLKRRELFQVGSEWLRVCSRRDPVNKRMIKGYLSELSSTNNYWYSNDFTQIQWGKASSAITAGSTSSPRLHNDASLLYSTGISASNSNIFYNFTTIQNDQYTISISAKYKDVKYLWISPQFNGVTVVHFDIEAGNFHSVESGAPDSYGIEDWGDGWYRCWVTETALAASGLRNTAIGISATPGSYITTLTSGQGCYIFGAQGEEGGFPSSYIETSASSVTRNTDQLRYDTSDGNAPTGTIGSVYCETLLPDRENAADSMCLELRSDASNTLQLRRDNTDNGAVIYYIRDSTGVLFNALGTNIGDEETHRSLVTWGTDAYGYTDSDTAESSQVPLARSAPAFTGDISVGMSDTAAWQPSGLLGNLIIYDKEANYNDVTALLEDFTMSAYGELSVSTTLTADVTAAGAAVKLGSKAGATTAGDLLNFTHTTPGRLTYTGDSTSKFYIVATIQMESDTINTISDTYIAKNGTTVTESLIQRLISVATDHGALAVSSIVELATNDYIELYVDGDKTAELASDNLNLVLVEIP